MKKIVISIVAALVSLSAFAQKTTVKGVVLDSLTRVGEPAAILQFYRLPDLDKAVAFTTTDEEGNFSHSFTLEGDYVLVFDNLGRQVQRRSFTVPADTDVVDLGEILAQDSAEMLQAGQVTAMRPLVKMEVDKMTYNVEDDVDSKTSTVLDMLRKVPMVSVDGQDNISVNGSSSFQVYVDGKPNQMMSQNASTIFKMMPASTVKSIEVVT
ncbi:MAG: Plug domain-containing protein, partial [Bacteroidales bacterium]|nr:Plug domain-containing protein [Bacteroidales bacterium]